MRGVFRRSAANASHAPASIMDTAPLTTAAANAGATPYGKMAANAIAAKTKFVIKRMSKYSSVEGIIAPAQTDVSRRTSPTTEILLSALYDFSEFQAGGFPMIRIGAPADRRANPGRIGGVAYAVFP